MSLRWQSEFFSVTKQNKTKFKILKSRSNSEKFNTQKATLHVDRKTMKTYRYLVWHLTKWDGGGSRIRSFILEYISMTFLRFTYLMDSRCRYFFASTLFKQICQKSKSGLSCFLQEKFENLKVSKLKTKIWCLVGKCIF